MHTYLRLRNVKAHAFLGRQTATSSSLEAPASEDPREGEDLDDGANRGTGAGRAAADKVGSGTARRGAARRASAGSTNSPTGARLASPTVKHPADVHPPAAQSRSRHAKAAAVSSPAAYTAASCDHEAPLAAKQGAHGADV